jgi:hypothetical protein
MMAADVCSCTGTLAEACRSAVLSDPVRACVLTPLNDPSTLLPHGVSDPSQPPYLE